MAGRPGRSSAGGRARAPSPLGWSSGRRPGRGLWPERRPPSLRRDATSGLCGVRPARPLPGLQRRFPGAAPQGLLPPGAPSPPGFLEPAPPGQGISRVSARWSQPRPAAPSPGGPMGTWDGAWGRAEAGGGGISPRPGRGHGGNRGGVRLAGAATARRGLDTALDGSWSPPWVGGGGDQEGSSSRARARVCV